MSNDVVKVVNSAMSMQHTYRQVHSFKTWKIIVNKVQLLMHAYSCRSFVRVSVAMRDSDGKNTMYARKVI